MAITYPLTLPAAFKSAEITITAQAVVAVPESPTTLIQQVQEWQGQRWMATIKLPSMKRTGAEQILATLLKLNGPRGTFYLGDTANKIPQGVATGTPLVSGTQTARQNSLATKGWTAGVTGILKTGDWIQVGTTSARCLYKVLDDVNSDGSGNATFDVWPRLRAAHANNTAIVTSAPTGVFRLVDSTQWTIQLARIYQIPLTAVEAL